VTRPIRYLPRPDTTFEITCKTVQSRFLLRPSKRANDLILGVIGRAMTLYPTVLVHMIVIVSNHIHLLITVPDSRTLALFMNHINSNIARELGRLYNWRDKFWRRRYRAIAIVDEQALLERVRYLLSHGCKEGLVRRPEDWPGVHCIFALRDGVPLSGTWFDRTKEYEAKRSGQEVEPDQFATRYPVPLALLPCFADLTESERRRRFAELVKDIEAEVWQKRLDSGRTAVLGVRTILSQSPQSRPDKTKRSKAPICHSSTIEGWTAFRDSYREFAQNFRSCARRLRKHRKPVQFPAHCFPPSIGYLDRPMPASG
jgi:REP element-mobilizing transposase RayT